jgi:hypothetical protein
VVAVWWNVNEIGKERERRRGQSHILVTSLLVLQTAVNADGTGIANVNGWGWDSFLSVIVIVIVRGTRLRLIGNVIASAKEKEID